MSRFEFVADHRDAFGVKRLCTVLNLSRSGFYRWLKTARARAAKKAADAALTRRIRKVHTESGKTYGAKLAVFRWLGFYNNRRRHSTIGYLAPVVFEQRSTRLAIAA
ncbi:hypothetical protein [Streptomyces sp. NRRL S-813]|uniref:hypothetical protein n=1 Tax=Streptomyces sp. NRRL S-813 TaxID=1463919 RepID=UPI00069081C5|nr:hypothetical protein [Streptomyces sp. NRRL S-813]